MMSDASDMLAAALEQMDGIIAGKVQNEMPLNPDLQICIRDIVQKLCIVHEWKNVPVECYSTCSVCVDDIFYYWLIVVIVNQRSGGFA